MRNSVQFVLKVSKFCNLCCSYCYEMPELGKRERMSRADLRRMYTHIAQQYAEGERIGIVEFIWHGGEPLLVEPDFYWATFADQREVFDDRLQVINVVQTNLTTLDEERLRLLTEGFDGVGVSVDLFGGLRVNLAGRDQQDRVLDNLRALACQRSVGCITVLNATNVHQLEAIFRFYEQVGFHYRVLPLFDTGDDAQTAPYAISVDEELSALCRLADLWLSSESMARPPSPLDEYVSVAARWLTGSAEDRYFDRRQGLNTFLVNTSGDCYTYGEPYGDPEWSLGNIFTTAIDDLQRGAVFDACVAAADKRQAANCLNCPYFGVCDGGFIADGERRARDRDAAGTAVCTARPVIEHLVSRLRGSMDIERLVDVASPQSEVARA